MAVATVAVVMSAVAIPIVSQGLRTYRLGAACTNVANLIQRTRYEAIRNNKTIRCRAAQQGSNWVLWIDLDDNKAWDATEPGLILPLDAPFVGAGVAPGPSSMGYPNAQVPNGAIAFDSRGTVDFGTGAATVYVIYMGSAQNAAKDGYKAITVTPIGKTKIWSTRGTSSWYTY